NQAESLARRDEFDVTLGVTGGFYYLRFDLVGKSGNKALADERVRRAILMSIKREELDRVLVGKWAPEVGRPYSLCEKSQTGCRTTVEPIGYDPETAKKLMEEAGYADGFDLTITSPP